MPVPRRILLTTWGSYGDLFPYLALAIRLKAMGHSPALATCEFYRDMVTAAGIEFHPMSPDVNPRDTALIARVMDPAHGTEVILRELIVPHVRAAFNQLRAAARDAELIVTHPVTFAAPLVARAMHRRWLSAVLAPSSMFSLTDFPVLPPAVSLVRLLRSTTWTARAFMSLARRITGPWTKPVRELAAELGLPDAGDPLYEGQFSPYGTLALFSPVLGPPQPDWPPRTRATGFVFHQEGQDLAPGLRAFLDAGAPPIVFTLGSSAVGAPGRFWIESVDAIARLRQRAVLLVGRGVAPPRIGTSPDVFVADFAPHAPLFARASVVVHHGGVGTTAQALRAGKPMLVVPHAHDQPDNAFRVRRLGVARVIDATRYRAGSVASQLRQLTQHGSYRARAADVHRVVAAERGMEHACETMLAACP
ncbi:MAG: glycosyltransferase [Acidobacteriota bacterium]